MDHDYCIFKINATGQLDVDVITKFPAQQRPFYTVLECGYKSREEALKRVEELNKEEAAKK